MISKFTPSSHLIKLLEHAPLDILLSQANSEAWFSNQLAWLMDPKGSHGLGVVFLQNILKTIGKKRNLTLGKSSKRRRSKLKFGRGGIGVNSSKLKLSNCSIFREFHLADLKRTYKKRSWYCDVVAIDLDRDDGFFLVIENKLFGQDSRDQLDAYYSLVENKFLRSKVREYVYLTLTGQKPQNINDYPKEWISLSWLEDIKFVLEKAIIKKSNKNNVVSDFLDFLEWFSNALSYKAELSTNFIFLKKVLLYTAQTCLLNELKRLNEGMRGHWTCGENNFYILHSSLSSRKLKISLQPGLTIAVHSKDKEFDKILIPLGAHPDQVFNLIDIAARDIYHLFFNDSTMIYLGNKRRRKHRKLSGKGTETYNFFKSLHKSRYALCLLTYLFHK